MEALIELFIALATFVLEVPVSSEREPSEFRVTITVSTEEQGKVEQAKEWVDTAGDFIKNQIDKRRQAEPSATQTPAAPAVPEH